MMKMKMACDGARILSLKHAHRAKIKWSQQPIPKAPGVWAVLHKQIRMHRRKRISMYRPIRDIPRPRVADNVAQTLSFAVVIIVGCALQTPRGKHLAHQFQGTFTGCILLQGVKLGRIQTKAEMLSTTSIVGDARAVRAVAFLYTFWFRLGSLLQDVQMVAFALPGIHFSLPAMHAAKMMMLMWVLPAHPLLYRCMLST